MDQDRVMAMVIRFQAQNEQVLSEISKKLDDIAKKAKEVAKEADNAMKQFHQGASQVGDVFKQVANVAGSALNGIIGVVKGLTTSVIDLAQSIISNVVSAFQSVISIAEKAGLAITGAFAAFGTIGVKAQVFREETMRALEAVSANKQEAQDLFKWLDKLSEKVPFTTEQVQTLGKQLRTQFSADQVKEMIPVLLQAGHIMKEVPLEQIFRMIMMAKEGMVMVRETAALGFGRKELAGFGVDINEDTGKIAKGSKEQLVGAELALLRGKYGTGSENENSFDVVTTTLTSRFRKIARTATDAFYESFKGAIGKVNDVLGNILEGQQGKQILEGLSSAFNVLGGVLENAAARLPDFIKWLSGIINSKNVVKVLGDIVGTFQFLTAEVMKFFGAVSGGKSLGDIFETFKTVAVNAISFVIRMWRGLVAGIQYLVDHRDEIWGAIQDGIDLVVKGFKVLVGLAFDFFAIVTVERIAGIASALINLGGGIGKVFGALGLRTGGAAAAGAGGMTVGAGLGIVAGGGLAAGALIPHGDADNLHDSMQRLLSFIGTGAATGGLAGGIFGVGGGAIPGAIIGGGIGLAVGGVRELYRFFRGKGASEHQAAAAAVAVAGSGGAGAGAGSQPGFLERQGDWVLGQLGAGASALGNSIPDRLKRLWTGGRDAVSAAMAGDPAAELAAYIANATRQIGGMAAPRGIPGGADNALAPRHDFHLGEGGQQAQAMTKDQIDQMTAYLDSEVERFKVISEALPEEERLSAELDTMVPILRQKQQLLGEEAKSQAKESKEYYDLSTKAWQIENQIVTLQNKAVKEHRHTAVRLSNAVMDTIVEQAKLMIDAAPDSEKSALEAKSMIPVLREKQQVIMAQAQEYGTSTEQYWEAQKQFWQIQGQIQSLSMKAMKDRQNQAREFIDAELGLAEAQLKNNPFLTERQKKEALIPFLAEKFTQAARPVYGESDIDKIRRFTSMENLKSDILKDAGFDLERNGFKTIEGGFMTLFDSQRVGGIMDELDRIQRQETMRGPEPPMMIPPANTAASVQLNLDTNLQDLPNIISNAVQQQLDEWVSQVFGGR